MFRRLLLAAAVMMFCPAVVPTAAANGEEALQAGEVVVTATMTEKTIVDAPGAVQVISAREMREMNALTVADALESAAGLVVSRESGRVRVPAIRGGRSKHTLVLLDGRRLAFGFNDMIDLRQIPAHMVERIEVVRGPASALFGSDALGGVVNIITRRAPEATTAELTGQYGVNRFGDAQSFTGGALVGGSLDRLRLLAAAESGHTQGWDQDGMLPDDGFRQRPRFAAGRVAFDFTDRQSLSGGMEYNDNVYTGDQFYENLARERRFQEERRGYHLQYDLRLKPMHQLLLRVNRSEYRNEMGFNPFAESGRRQTEQYINQAEARYSGLLWHRHLLTIGGELRRDGLDDTQMGLRTDASVDNSSVFAQNEFHLLDPLYVVLGLRYDNHSGFGDRWTPRASAIYSLTDALRLKGAYAHGFRAPSLTELNVTSFRRRGRDVYAANPDLEAESSITYELGIELTQARYYGRMTGFQTEVDNLIETVFDRSEGSGQNRRDFYQYRNIAEATLKGIEAEAGVRLPLGLTLDGNFTWLDVENRSGSENIGAQPEYKYFIKLGFHHPEMRLRANLRMSGIGRITYADGERYSYPLFGAYVAKGLGRHLELFAGVENILDKRIVRDGVTLIAPTTFHAGVSIRM
ncbi:TonB-dependent receptor plug domain-containing protein [Desulfatitalea alkaliphila]|uniref:TonB-dependent receptor n=1 Tax=Desulfatitalea alkaliphila TaxID=2929485 RepID=A0AA41R0B1_9BACT|nr:TonB-dependent receptor [Desulfatitalea alkaliphila]MCJ8499762.1 TonB-dependent receptor [Desulfatitalea alkaliphila]